MTAPKPVLFATKRPVGPAEARHPLATETGISLLAHIVAAGEVWRKVTKPQKAILAELCAALLPRLVDEGELTAADLPDLPDGTTVATREAMARRGLYSPAGRRLTPKAFHAWYWAAHWPSRERAS